MRKVNFLCVFLALLLSIGFQTMAGGEDTPKVLILITDGSPDLEFMLTKEVGVMKDMLEQASIEVDIATVSGEPIAVGSEKLDTVLKLSNVDADEYSGLILPCMAAEKHDAPEMVAVVKKAVEAGKPVAAQFGGVEYLARAGALKGKKYCLGTKVDVNASPEFSGGIYSGTGIVKDGNIITSGVCPFWAREKGLEDGTPGLIQALINAIRAKQ